MEIAGNQPLLVGMGDNDNGVHPRLDRFHDEQMDKRLHPSVRRHHRAARCAVANAAVGADAHERGRSGNQVAYEDVRSAVRVIGHNVAGRTFNQRVTAIR
jgi:hypothetical protein